MDIDFSKLERTILNSIKYSHVLSILNDDNVAKVVDYVNDICEIDKYKSR